MSNTRRLVTTASLMVAILVLGGSAAFAHDCFNPQKNLHAPTAGVHYMLVGFDSNGNPLFEQIGNGKGVGGFVEIPAGVFGNQDPLYTHSIGNSSSHEVVGGPGSQKPNHACDGKGIDYLDACGFFGG